MDSCKLRMLYGSFLLLLFALPCTAILCFTCHSSQNSGCGDNFKIQRSDAKNIFLCEGTCVKRRGKRSNGQVSRVEIQRSCIQQRTDGCYDEEWAGLTMYTCACNTNFCNSSTPINFTYVILILCFFLTLL